MELIKVINYNIDINQLLKIVNSYVYKDLPLRMDGFSVQTRLNVLDPWNLIDGLESLKLYPKGTVEQDFKFLNQIIFL